MNRSDLLLKKRKAPEKRQKRGCCGSTELPIVVATRSWREISCGKLGTLIKQTKNSLNFVSTCLKVVDTRRPGVAIGVLACVAALLVFESTRLEKTVWIVFVLGLFALESHAIYKDRAEHDAEQASLRAAEDDARSVSRIRSFHCHRKRSESESQFTCAARLPVKSAPP
jgi:hypothetical protein